MNLFYNFTFLYTVVGTKTVIMIYLQRECIENTSFSYVQNMIEHDCDVILGKVVPCRKLRWICRMDLNDVARQVETPDKSTIFVARQLYFIARHDFLVA